MFELDSKYEIDGILVKKYVKSIDALTISTKKIKENSKKEAIEKLRKQLDMTIRNNITLNRNNNSEDNNSANDYNSDEKIKHENILKLHKEGLSNKEIAAKLKCSLTEVDIIIELNNN